MANIEHKDITGADALHPFAEVAASDPGAIGAYKGWIDTSVTPHVLKYRNGANSAWIVYEGQPGADGADGVDGADGAPGAPGTNGTNGTNGANGIFSAIASQAEAEAGTEHTKGMTALRVAEAIAALGGGGGASDLDDLTDVVITAPTTDEVLKYNGTNWVNAAVPGGGGGAGFNLFSPDVPYTTPSTEDDEFEGASMAGKWTAIGTPTPAFNDPPSMLSLVGADAGITGYYQTTSGAIVIRGKFHLPGVAVSATSGQIGLFASNAAGTYIKEICARHYRPSASNNSIDVQVSYRVGRASGDYSTQHYNGTTQTGTQMIYLEIKKVASGSDYIYTYSYSLDGISFIPCYTQTLTNAIDLVRIGFHTQHASISTRIDWFRKLQGSYTGKLIAY
jgi:hypothetical protein